MLWVTGAIVQREKWQEVVAEIETLVERSAWRVTGSGMGGLVHP